MNSGTRRRILIFAGSGIGGTEKCATLFAQTLAYRGHAVGYVSLPGPRAESLERSGVTIFTPSDHPEVLAGIIRKFRAEIVHQHVPGYPCRNPIYAALELLRGRRIRLIETNVFGRLEDREGHERVDFRMFVSSASAAQAFRRASKKLTMSSIGNQMVVANPVRETTPRGPDHSSESFRRGLGVGKDEVLFYRIGQPGCKWTQWELEAFRLIKKTVPESRLLLMEPPKNLWKRIEPEASRLGVIFRKATSDFSWLEELNRSADIAIHASAWGDPGWCILRSLL